MSDLPILLSGTEAASPHAEVAEISTGSENGLSQGAATGSEGQVFRGSGVGGGDGLFQQGVVGEKGGQALRPRQFRKAAANLRSERDLFHGAVAAEANRAAEESVAGHLAGNGGAVQLEHDPVAGDGAQVGVVRHPAFQHVEATGWQACGQGLEQALSPAFVRIYDRDAGSRVAGHLERNGEGCEVIAGGLEELAGT